MSREDGRPAARRVAAELALRREQLGLSYAALSARTGIEKNRLQRLLGPSGLQLRLDELTVLCEALQVSRGDLVRTLWHDRPSSAALPPGAGPGRPDGARPVVPALAATGSTAELVALLSGSPDWAFSVLPVFSGPGPELRVHTIDRIAVTRSDPARALADHDLLRREFLSEFRGLPVGVSFSVTDSRAVRPAAIPHDPHGHHPSLGEARALYLRSMVYAADRVAAPNPIELGAAGRGVVVLSLRVASSPLDLAATVARALGWALVSTTRTGQLVSGYPAVDPRRSTRSANLYANLILSEYLATGAPRTVVAHAGTPTTDDSGAAVNGWELLDTPATVAPYVVLLSESDAFLTWCLGQAVNGRGDRSRFGLTTLIGWRDRLRERVEVLRGQGRALIVEHDPPCAHRGDLDADALSQLRWQATLQNSRTVLQQLLHLSGLPARATALRDPLARALLSHGSAVTWH